jgi:hypothetical protein
MTIRDTIIFAGTSHTIGKGLEWELDPELNSDEYLQNGVVLVGPLNKQLEYNKKYWRKYRWSRLVCEDLGYKEYNFYDYKLGWDAQSVILSLYNRKDENTIKELLGKTKYIVLEMGYVRWWDENLHGKEGGELLPNTPLEIEKYLNSKYPNTEVYKAAMEWVINYEEYEKLVWEELYRKVLNFTQNFPEIKILILPWKGGSIDNADKLVNWFIKVDGQSYKHTVHTYLEENKLCVYHKAKAFNGNYECPQLDEHASVEGHRKVADIVIEHIKKL